MNSIESVQKQKTQSYNLVKGSLTNLQRKRTWVAYDPPVERVADMQRQPISAFFVGRGEEGGLGGEQRVYGDVAGRGAKVSNSTAPSVGNYAE